MKYATAVFMLWESIEDGRPEIDFTRADHRAIDWLRVGQVLRGARPIADYPGVRLTVANRDATNWDFYSAAGTHGLISGRAVECLGSAVFRLFELLPATINDASYVFLRVKETLPCFDRERSVVVPFPSNPQRIMDVKEYKFKMEMIPDPICFCVPELFWLFATQSVKAGTEKCRLKGMSFRKLE